MSTEENRSSPKNRKETLAILRHGRPFGFLICKTPRTIRVSCSLPLILDRLSNRIISFSQRNSIPINLHKQKSRVPYLRSLVNQRPRPKTDSSVHDCMITKHTLTSHSLAVIECPLTATARPASPFGPPGGAHASSPYRACQEPVRSTPRGLGKAVRSQDIIVHGRPHGLGHICRLGHTSPMLSLRMLGWDWHVTQWLHSGPLIRRCQIKPCRFAN